MNQPALNNNSPCRDSITMAEQELAAFFNAVTELFGSEQAELSAQEWLHELVAADALPSSACEWRQLTIKISARLAKRVNALSVATSRMRLCEAELHNQTLW